MSDFEKLKKEFISKINQSQSKDELENLSKEFMKFINLEFKKLASLSAENKKEVASKINHAKEELLKIYNEKDLKIIEEALNTMVLGEKEDLTLPGRHFEIGKIHQND